MREIKKQLYIRRDEILFILGIEAGMFLAGEVLVLIMMRLSVVDTLVELGAIMALGVAAVILLFSGMSVFAACFNMGISMGTVRRRLFPAYLAVTYLECLAVCAEAGLLHRLELQLFQAVYPGVIIESAMEQVFQWKYILPGIFFVTACSAFFGMLFLKFGNIGIIAIWVLWVGAAACMTRAEEFLQAYRNTAAGKMAAAVTDYFRQAAPARIGAALAGVSLVLILISWLFVRRQQVTL